MASNVKNFEASNDPHRKELLITSSSTQESEQESQDTDDELESVEPVDCSSRERQHLEQPVAGPLLSYHHADDPVARTQSMILLSVLEVKGSVDKICSKITEQFNKGGIDAQKLLQFFQEKEEAADKKIDAQSLLLHQILVQIRDDVLPRLQTTSLHSQGTTPRTTKLSVHSSDREGSAKV